MQFNLLYIPAALETVQSRPVFRLLRHFSTVLSLLRYSFETRLSASDSRSCLRSVSLRTVTEKSLMPLKTVLLVVCGVQFFEEMSCLVC